ncbi:hypothetical protein DL765_007582 [Monosporascus sp. GIB2]|nr:hypothetical protein DL765_007582 [Monosporascus sp. GIB2]
MTSYLLSPPNELLLSAFKHPVPEAPCNRLFAQAEPSLHPATRHAPRALPRLREMSAVLRVLHPARLAGSGGRHSELLEFQVGALSRYPADPDIAHFLSGGYVQLSQLEASPASRDVRPVTLGVADSWLRPSSELLPEILVITGTRGLERGSCRLDDGALAENQALKKNTMTKAVHRVEELRFYSSRMAQALRCGAVEEPQASSPPDVLAPDLEKLVLMKKYYGH